MKKIFLFLILVTSTITTYAQAPDRSAPPELGKAKNLQLPPLQRFELSNGLKVLLMEKHNVPLVQMNLVINTGSFNDPNGKEGLSSFTMDMLDEGAGSLNSLELADEIEFLGASIRTRGGNFTSEVNCSLPVSKLEPVLKLMTDIVLKPTFSETELERLKKLELNGLLENYDNPGVIAQQAFGQLIFGEDSPYGKSPNEQSVKSFSVADCKKFHAANFNTGNSLLVIVGDVDQKTLKPLLEKYFGTYPKGQAIESKLSEPKQISGRNIYLIDKPGSAQSVIFIGRMGPSRMTPDYNAIEVMNTLLGGSFTSRLNSNLREKNGYSYGARSSFSFWKIPSPFAAYSSVQTDATGPALTEFFNEFNGMLKPIPEEDYLRAKNYDALGYAAGFETNAEIASKLASLEWFQLPDNYYNTYVDKALAVTKEEVEAAAKEYIVPSNMLVVIVGDREKVEQPIIDQNIEKPVNLTIEDILGKKPELK